MQKYTRVIIVRHGETEWNKQGLQQGHLDSIIRYVLDIPLHKKRSFSLLNSAINSFIYINDSWFLETWGDVSHLKGIEAPDDF